MKVRFLEIPYWRVLSRGTWNLIGKIRTLNCWLLAYGSASSPPFCVLFCEARAGALWTTFPRFPCQLDSCRFLAGGDSDRTLKCRKKGEKGFCCFQPLSAFFLWPARTLKSIASLRFFKKFFIYLFLERGKGREEERERNVDVSEKHCLVASCTHHIQGPNLQPRHVLWLGIELVTFCFCRMMPNQLNHTGQGSLRFSASFDPAIPLLGIYPKEPKTLIWKNISTPMFIAALFTIAKVHQ